MDGNKHRFPIGRRIAAAAQLGGYESAAALSRRLGELGYNGYKVKTLSKILRDPNDPHSLGEIATGDINERLVTPKDIDLFTIATGVPRAFFFVDFGELEYAAPADQRLASIEHDITEIRNHLLSQSSRRGLRDVSAADDAPRASGGSGRHKGRPRGSGR